jgi:hypothetical protein
MLDLGLVQRLLFGQLLAARGVENLLLQLGVDGELHANLLHEFVLARVLQRALEVGKELLDSAMVLLEKGNSAFTALAALATGGLRR